RVAGNRKACGAHESSAPLRLCERPKSRFPTLADNILRAFAPLREKKLRVSTSPREPPRPRAAASFPPPARRIALARHRSRQSDRQLLAQPAEIALDPAFAADQHMVVIGQPALRQRLAQQRAEAALHAVAHNRIADLLGDGDAIAY